MKKSRIFIFVLYCILNSLLFSQKYQITNVEYDIKKSSILGFTGKTRPYALENNVSVDKNKIFETKEELDEYLKDYETRLYNTKAFDSIEVITNFSESENEERIIFVNLQVNLQDTIHILAVPYPKYNSNSGFELKLKAKDTNFLGSLNTMSSDFNFAVEQEDEFSEKDIKAGISFAFDNPFKMGIFDATWVNDYSFDYNFTQKTPEWDAKTGLKLELPLEKLSYILEFNQYFIKDNDYKSYDDEIYFTEEAVFSVPIKLFKIKNWADVEYKPYLSALFNWDFNTINQENNDLSSPTLTLGHSISTKRINWNKDFRKGISVELLNSYSYNFQRRDFYPYIKADFSGFMNFSILEDKNFFSKIGITNHTQIFHYFNNPNSSNFYSNEIGEYLRGIRDNQYYKNQISSDDTNALRTSTALVINIDFPIHIFTTNFTSNFLSYFNFDFQLSPFFDFALMYNRLKNEWFLPEDGFYSAGIEVLVYPLKWAGFTVRGSIGFDIGRILLSDFIDTSWRDDVSKWEISFGVGLHY